MVPLQTVLALVLALVVNGRLLRGKGFFRTAFYFPSVTSSVAISVVFLFLFANSGAINALLRLFGINGPHWFSDPRGVLHIILGALGLVDPDNPPARAGRLPLPRPVGLGLAVRTERRDVRDHHARRVDHQRHVHADVPGGVAEHARSSWTRPRMIDGATRWQRFRRVTLPQLKPTLFLVITLGLIGTWQVFDQIYVMSKGNPAKTTLTPAYLSYRTAFVDFNYGSGAAISFVLFLIIVILTLIQRWVMRDRDARRARAPSVRAGMARSNHDATLAVRDDPTRRTRPDLDSDRRLRRR